MRARLALLLALWVGADAHAATDRRQLRSWGRVQRGVAAASPVLLDFAPASGAGLIAGDDTLCDNPALTPHLVGSYTCLNGDGTSVSSAGMALSPVGSPTTDTRAVCSNGPDCATSTSQRISSTAYYQTASAVSLPTGDFSACVLLQTSTATGFQYLLSQNAGSPNMGPSLFTNGANVSAEIINSATAASAVTASGANIVGAWRLYCMTYARVGEGTSTLNLYVDGAPVASTSTAVASDTGTSRWKVARRGDDAFPMNGAYRFVLVTEKALSAADVAAVAKAALGTLAGTKGEALTLTRATVSTCCRDDGTGCVVLPPGRACWAGGKLKVRPVAQNFLPDSRMTSMDNVGPGNTIWFARNLTIERGHADCNPAPDGTWTAIKLTANAADAALMRDTFAPTNPSTLGFLVRLATATPAAVGLQADGGGSTSQAVPAAWTWLTRGTTGTVQSSVALGGFSTWDTSDGAVCVAAAQHNPGTTLLDYCPTGAAPASCAAEVPSIPNPLAGTGPAKWCVGVTASFQGQESVLVETGAFNTSQAFTLDSGGGSASASFIAANAASVYKIGKHDVVIGAVTNRRVVGCFDNGTPLLWVNGASVPVTTSVVGPATGIITSHLPTLYFGARAGGAFNVNGSLGDVRVCRTEAACL